MTAPVPSPPPTQPEPRRGLGAGWITFIVVDVLLVLFAVWLAVSVLSDGSDGSGAQSDAESTTSTSTQTGATGDGSPGAASSPRPDGTETTFTAPSRNITCTITEQGARCGIAELASAPAPVDSCDGTIGYVYAITAEGNQVPCVPSDQQPEPAGDDVDVLDYGQSVTEFGFTCESSEDGISCRDEETGNGFRLARAGGTPF